MGRRIALNHTNEFHYLECIREALIAHMDNAAPFIAIEQARKVLSNKVRPTFYELEKALLDDNKGLINPPPSKSNPS